MLIDQAHPFTITYVFGVLSHQVAGVLRFYLAMDFLLLFLSLQGNDLSLGLDKSILGYTGFQRIQALVKDLQIVAFLTGNSVLLCPVQEIHQWLQGNEGIHHGIRKFCGPQLLITEGMHGQKTLEP